MRARPLWTLAFVLLLGASLAARAADQLTQSDALALAFPGATLERKEHFLTDAQREQIQKLAEVEVRSKYLVSYEARIDKALQGVAFFDTHLVRTQPETLMVAISPRGVIVRIEVVQFREPQEYAAPERWTRQLVGQTLGPRLSLKAEVKPLSGASLTAQAMVDASRRALAEFQVLYPRAASP
jgi:hypothetical protein